MRDDPASEAIIIVLRSPKMHGMVEVQFKGRRQYINSSAGP